jgi:hypothetical protein
LAQCGRTLVVMGKLLFFGPVHEQVSFLRDTKSIGDLSEILFAGKLVLAGYRVAVPLGENQRYDLIIEKNEVLSRVQVKTGRVRNGAVIFNCYSSHTHRKGPSSRPYTGQVDFFGIYCQELDIGYLVPIADLARLSGSLRLQPTRNGQQRHVRWARRYELGTAPRARLKVGDGAQDGVCDSDSGRRRRSLVVKHRFGKAESAGSIPADGSILLPYSDDLL